MHRIVNSNNNNNDDSDAFSICYDCRTDNNLNVSLIVLIAYIERFIALKQTDIHENRQMILWILRWRTQER